MNALNLRGRCRSEEPVSVSFSRLMEKRRDAFSQASSRLAEIQTAQSKHESRKRKRKTIVIFMKDLRGKTVSFVVENTTLVEELKEQVFAKCNVKVEIQRLIYAGRQLKDGETMEDNGVRSESTLHLVTRLLGC